MMMYVIHFALTARGLFAVMVSYHTEYWKSKLSRESNVRCRKTTHHLWYCTCQKNTSSVWWKGEPLDICERLVQNDGEHNNKRNGVDASVWQQKQGHRLEEHNENHVERRKVMMDIREILGINHDASTQLSSDTHKRNDGECYISGLKSKKYYVHCYMSSRVDKIIHTSRSKSSICSLKEMHMLVSQKGNGHEARLGTLEIPCQGVALI